MSEARTLRRKRFRRRLFEAFDGRCAICGIELKEDWHADHIVPWKVRQETNFYAMQALCPSCNARKGAKTEGEFQMNNSRMQSDINIENARPGQKGAIQVTLDRLSLGLAYTAVVLPTRYGKSDVIRATAIVAHHRGIVSYAVVLSPAKVLKKQIIKAWKWKKTLHRYGLPRHTKFQSIESTPPHPRNDSGAFFMSGTLQSLVMNVGEWVEWVRNAIAVTGKPPVIYIDETHMAGIHNKWGKAIECLAEAGAKIVLLTATASRTDGDDIPGFEYDVVDEEEYQWICRKPGSLPEKVLIEVYEGTRGSRKIHAHHITTFAEAYAESPAPICRLHRDMFDVDLTKIMDGMKESLMLSDASESVTRTVLSRVVRKDIVINQAVELLLKHLRQAKRVDGRAQAIVFVGNDRSDSEDNQHARDVEAAIRAADKSVRVTIITSSNTDDGADEILRFAGEFDVDETADPPEKPIDPVGDIVIVKQMAGLGVEFPAVKVMLDLSCTRAETTWVQRVMRIATLWGHFKSATLITPNDVLSAALFKRVTADGLGEATRLSGELSHSYEVDKKDAPDRAKFYVDGASPAGFEDSTGDTGTTEDQKIIDDVIRRFPLLKGLMLPSEILARAKADLSEDRPLHAPSDVHDVDSEKLALRTKLTSLSHQLRDLRCGVPAVDFEREMTSVWDDAKRIAGCRREHVKALGVEQLHAIAAAFEGMIDQEISAKKAS